MKSLMLQLLASFAVVGGVFGFGLLAQVNTTTVALILVLAILCISVRWGFPAAVCACAAGIAGLDYFYLPPDGFGISDPQQWVAVAAFVSTALIGSSLSVNASRRALEATTNRAEIERLYKLSQAIQIRDTERETLQQVPQQIVHIFGFREVACYDSASHRTFASFHASPFLLYRLRLPPEKSEMNRNVESDIHILPLQIGDRTLGSIGFCGEAGSEELSGLIAHAVAHLMETARERETAARLVEIQKAGELRTTLIDAVAHELKTPLTSIKAAVSCLHSQALYMPDEDRELLRIIRQETERFDRVLDGVAVKANSAIPPVSKYPVDLDDVVRTAVEDIDVRIAHRIVFAKPNHELPQAYVDPVLIEQVLVQLLENALKYSPPESAVIVSTEALDSNETIVVNVADCGAGISEEERTKIFDPLYRGPAHDLVPGTGMGLAIAKRIMDAHGGGIWVTKRDGGGSVFSISMAAHRQWAAHKGTGQIGESND